MGKDVLIVGTGLFGSICARELTDAGFGCLVIERRQHIGGNCYTRRSDEAGCHEHVYGPHIFHTDKPEVWQYINRFTRFNHFVNRPKVRCGNNLYSFPVNLFTLYQMFGVSTPQEALAKLEEVRIPCNDPQDMESLCLAQVGPQIYETFIKGYTTKQWGRSPSELPASIVRRLPVRLTFDDNYYTHPHQGIPVDGYTAIFERLLEGIPVELGVDFLEDVDGWLTRFERVIYTGPLDAFFGYRHGPLAYRTLRFESELLDQPDYQGNAIISYTDLEVPFTRIVEHKHFDLSFGSRRTLITREYPAEWRPGDDPYYPIESALTRPRVDTYRALTAELAGKVVFGGRLGEYRYYDMDQVISLALRAARALVAGQ